MRGRRHLGARFEDLAACFAYELIIAQPNFAAILGGLVPAPQIVLNPSALYIAIGILGATVMPHNLYLHSSIVQTRAFERSVEGKRKAIKFATIDSTVALLFAFFDALQLRLQQAGGGVFDIELPYQAYLMLPYAMAIVALVVVARRAAYPQALMKPYRKGER